MALDFGGPVSDTVKTACPFQCRLRHSAAVDDPANDQGPARYHVEWAGFPVDLGLVFSPQQCDRVYVQHLLRQSATQLWRSSPNGAQRCDCDIEFEYGLFDPNATRPISCR
ncbi:hypothetical protein B586_01935 [Mycobacterium haemophilum DSM 44634]|nr:hypothetical protein B586_01935 [Mycobacterium haemophilum DSM 44634]